MLSRFAALITLAGLASAHFTLDYPPARGFVEDIETQFCGGFKDANATRTPFPLGSGGFLTLKSEHDTATITVIISFKENPTGFTDFTKNDSGGDQAPLQKFFQVSGQESYCIPVNVADLKYPGVTDGTKATIQVQYTGGDGDLFQCADVVLQNSATVPSTVKCENPVGSLASSAPGSSSTGGSSPSNTGSSTAKPTPTSAASLSKPLSLASGVIVAVLGAALAAF